MATNFYVYAYYREDGTPYYIGKGKGWRARDGQGKPCKRPKDSKRIVILDKDLTEEQAFDLEKLYIGMYGRKGIEHNGILYNKSPGGQGTAGLKRPDLTARNKRGQTAVSIARAIKTRGSQKGERNPNFGNIWSEEQKATQSARLMGNGKGRRVSEETRQRMAAARKKYWENKRGDQSVL